MSLDVPELVHAVQTAAETNGALIAELVKFFGALVAAGAAIAGVFLDGMKSIDSGLVTRKGRIVIASALTGLLLSSLAQVAQIVSSQASARALQRRNEETANRLERIPRLIAKQSFPLEPLEFMYLVEVPMDQPALKIYSERLKKFVIDKYGADNRVLHEDILYSVRDEFKNTPFDNDEERIAGQLLDDHMRFFFTTKSGSIEGQTVLQFSSAPAYLQDLVVAMKSRGQLEQRVELIAIFPRRVFVKRVRCINPLRSGTDLVSFSTVDLVGKPLTWKSGIDSPLTWSLVSFGMRFSYDYGFQQNHRQLPAGREIDTSQVAAVTISAENVGLAPLFFTSD